MKHFSMIRSFHAADLLTMAKRRLRRAGDLPGHAFQATGGAALWIAAALAPLALVFDVLDGRARPPAPTASRRSPRARFARRSSSRSASRRRRSPTRSGSTPH
ncbi:MAG: hypothetical protein U0802_20345 [Candidatus Binatia bacterium]